VNVSCRDLDLWAAHVFSKRVRHPIQVRWLKGIWVHEDKISDAKVYDLLGNKRPDAAEADDRNPQTLKFPLSGRPKGANLTVEHLGSGLSSEHRIEEHFAGGADSNDPNAIAGAETAGLHPATADDKSSVRKIRMTTREECRKVLFPA
jgi:hypothetical protein